MRIARILRAAPREVTFRAVLGDIVQPTHLLFILIVALLVLGPKRLPEVGRALGRGMRDFRDAVTHSRSEAQQLLYGESDDDGPPADSALAMATAAPMAASTEPQATAVEDAGVAAPSQPPAHPAAESTEPDSTQPVITAAPATRFSSGREQLDAEPIYGD